MIGMTVLVTQALDLDASVRLPHSLDGMLYARPPLDYSNSAGFVKTCQLIQMGPHLWKHALSNR